MNKMANNFQYSENVKNVQTSTPNNVLNGSGNTVANNTYQNLKSNKDKGKSQEFLSKQLSQLKTEHKSYRNLLFKFMNSQPDTDIEFHYIPQNDSSNGHKTIIFKSRGIGGYQNSPNKGTY